MRSISLSVVLVLLVACAHVAPASMPSSAPAILYVPVDADDPIHSRGYTVSSEAADFILANKIHAKQQCEIDKLDLQESNELCQAQVDTQKITAWDVWGKPLVVGLLSAAVFGFTGYEVGKAVK